MTVSADAARLQARHPDVSQTASRVRDVLWNLPDGRQACGVEVAVGEIATTLGVAARTVQRALRELESSGLLEVSTARTGRGWMRTYRLSCGST